MFFVEVVLDVLTVLLFYAFDLIFHFLGCFLVFCEGRIVAFIHCEESLLFPLVQSLEHKPL
jgi:hypothetical protein